MNAEMTQLIIAEVDRIRGLIDRMESFGDTRGFTRHPVNIHEVLDRVRKVAESGFARGVTIIENFDPSLPPVSGDRDQLIQVLLNLVRNASDALPDTGGEITLTTGYRPGVKFGARPGGRARVAAAGSDRARQWLGRAGGSAATISSILLSPPRCAAPDWGWRWSPRSSATMAASSSATLCRGAPFSAYCCRMAQAGES